jgi:LDH2 family malate/lactate/ureidoglycolate dehydrogenase
VAARPPGLEPELEPSPEPGGGAGDGPGGAAVAPRVAAGQLTSFAAAVLATTGVPDGDARLVADSLVRADLWGHQSHGVLRLPWYVRRIRAGVMQAVTDPELVVDAGAVAVLDGRDGVGQVLAARAAAEAVRRARVHGIGAAGVRNSNHFGTAAYFTRMAPPEGCVGVLATNASPAMAPWGGREKAVGTNPWSVAAPAGRFGMMVMDIANTAVARGKVYLAEQQGRPVPAGWAIDRAGSPTTDPAAALAGTILPMAGHKGYTIALMVDVLAGVLTGGASGQAVHCPYQSEHRSGCGHLFVALDVGTFLPLAEFGARMERLVDQLKAVPRAEGVAEILYPGELEDRSEARNRREGLELPDQTLADLARLGRETGVEFGPAAGPGAVGAR